MPFGGPQMPPQARPMPQLPPQMPVQPQLPMANPPMDMSRLRSVLGI
jgi:hypothetical protein